MGGKITIFKSLAISKILHLAIITKVTNTVIEGLKSIKKRVFFGIIKNEKLNKAPYAIMTKMVV